jgi:hypothetical protein
VNRVLALIKTKISLIPNWFYRGTFVLAFYLSLHFLITSIFSNHQGSSLASAYKTSSDFEGERSIVQKYKSFADFSNTKTEDSKMLEIIKKGYGDIKSRYYHMRKESNSGKLVIKVSNIEYLSKGFKLSLLAKNEFKKGSYIDFLELKVRAISEGGQYLGVGKYRYSGGVNSRESVVLSEVFPKVSSAQVNALEFTIQILVINDELHPIKSESSFNKYVKLNPPSDGHLILRRRL